MNSKKTSVVVVASLCLVLLLVIGGTYAYWTTTKVQTDTNDITTTCLSVTLSNANASGTATSGISLLNTYPISDDEGKSTTGYTFTITNNCDVPINYDVNLENMQIGNNTYGTTDVEGNAETTTANETANYYIRSKYIDVTIDNNTTSTNGDIKTLAGLTDAAQSYVTSGTSYEQKKLVSAASLNGKASVTYTLKLWLDKDAPETQMSKSYQGKVVVYSWLGNSNPETLTVQ